MALLTATTAFTPNMTKLALSALKDDFDSTDNYHLVFSRSHPWTPDQQFETPPDYNYSVKRTQFAPIITPDYIDDFLKSSIASIRASAINIAAPIGDMNPTGPTISTELVRPYWQKWDKFKTSSFPQDRYTIYRNTSNNRVYACIKSGSNGPASTVVPSTVSTSSLQITYPDSSSYADDTRQWWWKYLFTLTADDVNQAAPLQVFSLTNIYPIHHDSDVRANAVKGQIVGYQIIDAGENISATPTVVVRGDGTGATAKVTVSDGKLTSIYPTNISSLGSGYTRASVRITGSNSGREPIVRPIIADGNGLGYDPAIEGLAHTYLFNFPAPAGNTDFFNNLEWRSLGIVRNLKKFATDSDFTDSSGRAYTTLNTGSTFAVKGHKVARTTEPFTQGYVIGVDSANGRIRVYQHDDPFTEFGFTQGSLTYNLNYGEDSWGTSGTLINLNTTQTATYNSVVKPDFKKNSGELLYLYSFNASKLTTTTPNFVVQLRL